MNVTDTSLQTQQDEIDHFVLENNSMKEQQSTLLDSEGIEACAPTNDFRRNQSVKSNINEDNMQHNTERNPQNQKEIQDSSDNDRFGEEENDDVPHRTKRNPEEQKQVQDYVKNIQKETLVKGGKRDYLVELLTSKILQDVVTFVGISATQPDQSYLLKFYSNRDKVRRERQIYELVGKSKQKTIRKSFIEVEEWFISRSECYSIDQKETIVLKYYEKGSLKDNIYELRLRDEKALHHLFAGIARKIHTMHYLLADSKCYIHRNLKSENVVIVNDQLDSYLIEFSLTTSAVSTTQTKNQKAEKNLYSGPEMAKGQYSANCDVWAFGLMVYEIFNSGVKLFSNIIVNTLFDKDQSQISDEINKKIKNLALEDIYPSNYDFWQRLLNGCLTVNHNLRWNIKNVVNFIESNKFSQRMLQSNVSLNYLLKLKFEHFKAHFIYEQVLRIIENSSFKDSPVDHFHIYCLLKFALYALYNLERMAKQVEKNVFMNQILKIFSDRIRIKVDNALLKKISEAKDQERLCLAQNTEQTLAYRLEILEKYPSLTTVDKPISNPEVQFRKFMESEQEALMQDIELQNFLIKTSACMTDYQTFSSYMKMPEVDFKSKVADLLWASSKYFYQVVADWKIWPKACENSIN